jgi:hypothetical protein
MTARTVSTLFRNEQAILLGSLVFNVKNSLYRQTCENRVMYIVNARECECRDSLDVKNLMS